MHDLTNVPESSARTRTLSIVGLLAVVGGTYAAYKMTQHERTMPRVLPRSSVAPTSSWWAGLVLLLFRVLRTADESISHSPWSRHALRRTNCQRHQGRISHQSALGEPLAGPDCGDMTRSQRPRSSLGEHSQWLESFRTQQAHRLTSDPSTD